MSKETEDALDEAIRAHVAAQEEAEDGEIVTDWVVLAASYVPSADDDANGYREFMRPGQPFHSTLGLILNTLQSFQANGTASLIAPDEDD